MAEILNAEILADVQAQIVAEIASLEFPDRPWIDLSALVSPLEFDFEGVRTGLEFFSKSVYDHIQSKNMVRISGKATKTPGWLQAGKPNIHRDNFTIPRFVTAVSTDSELPAGTVSLVGIANGYQGMPVNTVVGHRDGVPYLIDQKLAASGTVELLQARDGQIMKLVGDDMHARAWLPGGTIRFALFANGL